MYLLIRQVSDYDGPTLLLGCFDSLEQAEQQRTRYLLQLGESDPWHEQSYREVDLAQDLQIQPIEFESSHDWPDKPFVYVMSCYSEGFGQTLRGFIKVFQNAAVAQQCLQHMQVEDEQADFPQWHSVVKVSLNQLVEPDYQRWRSGRYD